MLCLGFQKSDRLCCYSKIPFTFFLCANSMLKLWYYCKQTPSAHPLPILTFFFFFFLALNILKNNEKMKRNIILQQHKNLGFLVHFLNDLVQKQSLNKQIMDMEDVYLQQYQSFCTKLIQKKLRESYCNNIKVQGLYPLFLKWVFLS